MRLPRILYILHCYYNRGGTEAHTRHLMAALDGRFETMVVAPHERDLVVISRGREIARLPYEKAAWPVTPYRMPANEAALAQLLSHYEPDIIHIQHMLHWPLSVIDQCAASGRPVVLSCHDYYAITPHFTMEHVAGAEETLGPAYSQRIFGADISEYLQRRRVVIASGMSKVNARIAPSDFCAREHGKVFTSEYRVIENGIPAFEPLAKRNHDKFRFGYVGTLIPQKGWEFLVRAFARLVSGNPAVELHLFGGGQKIQQCSVPNVFVHGVYEEEELPRIFSEIDVAVIPSVFPESYSLVLSEAWQAGLVPVVSRIGALGERVVDLENGRLFVPGDLASIADTLEWFVKSDEWRTWSLPKPRLLSEMAEEYGNLYESLLGGR